MSAAFISPSVREGLLANGRASAAGGEIDPQPVVKLFTPDANATWLLTELDPDDPGIAFGLCDLGLGTPELGYVALAELACIRPDKPLSAYAAEARHAGRIIT